MNTQQKEKILSLLEADRNSGDYTKRYWFSYHDYLDPTDGFTDFSCERLDGKREYIALIENILKKDETAEIYVEVYGLEDVDERCITADTLILFSRLPLNEIEEIFNEPEGIFPSEIGEITDFTRPTFLIGDNGELISGTELFGEDFSVYYCWRD